MSDSRFKVNVVNTRLQGSKQTDAVMLTFDPTLTDEHASMSPSFSFGVKSRSSGNVLQRVTNADFFKPTEVTKKSQG